ncbi:hypothetical protein GCM10010260_30880 [Streptomyces filipinensis]|uniref:Uncharacterized protein n=1 Tax=Streptomyces filipinensis TaxID=66887 RepID=A0A918IAW6_9ACTN|nr:hypothetical protein GCM10010260_30880 [Streptomyces filipinensis]
MMPTETWGRVPAVRRWPSWAAIAFGIADLVAQGCFLDHRHEPVSGFLDDLAALDAGARAACALSSTGTSWRQALVCRMPAA